MPRMWKRKPGRMYSFNCADAQAIVFGAAQEGFWAWGVWGHHFRAEGIECSLERAKKQANENIDQVLKEMAQC